MQIETLTLRNFKGVAELVLEPRGSDITVYGDNATGKTTIADAFAWLLFDKDSRGRSDFEIKTLDESGEPMHGLEHEVSATLDLEPSGSENTDTIGLRKVYREKWQKKRGSADKQFTGHTTEHFVDGVPVKQAEYNARVAQIADADVFKLLTDPAHFAERLHWQERRELLLRVCGDVSPGDVFDANADLEDLREIITPGLTLSEHRKVVNARRAEINRELERIPVRIDEAQRSVEAVPLDRDAVEAQVKALRAERESLETTLHRAELGGEIAEKEKELAEVDTEIQRHEIKERSKNAEKLDALRASVRQAEDALASAMQRTTAARDVQSQARDRIHEITKDLGELRARWHEIDSSSYEGDEICAACGQALPADEVAAAREKYNAGKARDLESIDVAGKRLRQRRGENEERLRQAEQDEKECLAAERDLLENVNRAKRDVEAFKASEGDDGVPSELRKRKAQVETAIASLRSDAAGALEKLKLSIDQLAEQITDGEKAIARFDATTRAEKRIVELEREERKLAAEYERLERELWLADEFLRTKVGMLESKINARFALARFRLFKPLIGGGVEECCDVTFEGVPYGSNLNHGARINVGLDIIRTLQEHFAISPPVFVDRCESVTSLIDVAAQVVRLIVSEADAQLRVEYSPNWGGGAPSLPGKVFPANNLVEKPGVGQMTREEFWGASVPESGEVIV